jgi:hypothetical protein
MNKCLSLVHLTRRHGAVGVRINIRVFQQSWNYSIHGHKRVSRDLSRNSALSLAPHISILRLWDDSQRQQG